VRCPASRTRAVRSGAGPDRFRVVVIAGTNRIGRAAEDPIATTHAFPSRALARLALAALVVPLALAAGGCGKKHKATTPVGDEGGEHLLVFTTTRASGTTEYDVALFDLDLGGYRSLVNLNNTYGQSEPCISDDGQYVVFASARPTGSGGSDLYLYKRVDQALVPTPGLNSGSSETWPRFTHDSVRLCFARDSLGHRRIRLYEPVGDTLVSTPGISTTGPFDDDEPAPDLHGDRIAFVSTRYGNPQLMLWDRASGMLTPAGLAGDSLDHEPSLSANGRWLAFASNRSGGAGGWDVYLYDVANARFVRLPRANTAADERHPSVSADGSRLAFAAKAAADTHWSLWVYTLADSSRAQPAALAGSNADDREPYLRWR